MIEELYRKFLESSGKLSSYNLAYAWISRQDECDYMSEAHKRELSDKLSRF